MQRYNTLARGRKRETASVEHTYRQMTGPGIPRWIYNFRPDSVTENRIRNGFVHIPLPCLAHSDARGSQAEAVLLWLINNPTRPKNTNRYARPFRQCTYDKSHSWMAPFFLSQDPNRTSVLANLNSGGSLLIGDLHLAAYEFSIKLVIGLYSGSAVCLSIRAICQGVQGYNFKRL